MNFSERLKALRIEKKLTQEELAQVLSLDNSTISLYESGKREPDYFTLQRLADLFGVSTDYLLGRTDDPLLPPGAFQSEVVPLPIYGEIRAGLPMLVAEEIIGYEYVPREDIKGGEYFWLRVKGDSMIGARIYPGDLVLVRRQDTLENGQIGVVIIGEEATIKRVYRQGNQYILVPENPAYQPQVYSVKEVRIIGEVVEGKYKLNGRQ